jgi:hypothetical protein
MAWYRAGDRRRHAFTSTGPGRARTCTHAVPLVCRSFDPSIPGLWLQCTAVPAALTPPALPAAPHVHRQAVALVRGGQRLRRELLARRWALEDARADLAIVAREGARVRGALLRARQHEVGTHAAARARTPRASERETGGGVACWQAHDNAPGGR